MQTRSKRKLFDDYTRVTPECPCAACGRPDWCLVSLDGRSVICSRVTSNDKRGKAGWFHRVANVKRIPPRTKKVYLSIEQVKQYIDSVSGAGTAHMVERQARMLGLSYKSINAMRARYDSRQAVLVFPMFDAQRRPVGCRFRRADGRKWSLKGGREGVFISRWFRPEYPVFIAEGPTDCATLIAAGFPNVLGRPNCGGGGAIIRDLLRNNLKTPVVILSDPDECGRVGSADLANLLPNPTIVVVGPTDIREHFLQMKKRKLTAGLQDVIIEGLTSDEGTTFTTAYRNRPGQFFNFEKAVE